MPTNDDDNLPIIPPDTPLFSFDDVKIEIQDLVRTGFMDKYNQLAQAVIYNIDFRFEDEEAGTAGDGGNQILQFHTNKGVIEVPIYAGSGGVIGPINAEDVFYDDAQGRYDNVQEALDALLNPYAQPTGSLSATGVGNREIGVTTNLPVVVTVVGNKRSEPLEYVKFTNPDGSEVEKNDIPEDATSASTSGSYGVGDVNIDPTIPSTYTWRGYVKDIVASQRQVGTQTLKYVYPYYSFNNNTTYSSVSDFETFLNSAISSGLITSKITGSAPSYIRLTASTSPQFMYIVIPDDWGKEVVKIGNNLGENVPGWDTEASPDNDKEFRRWDVILNKSTATSGSWTEGFSIYVSKIQKSNLYLDFTLGNA